MSLWLSDVLELNWRQIPLGKDASKKKEGIEKIYEWYEADDGMDIEGEEGNENENENEDEDEDEEEEEEEDENEDENENENENENEEMAEDGDEEGNIVGNGGGDEVDQGTHV